MKIINPDPLDTATQRILAEIETLSLNMEEFAPERLERMARALSVQLKAIADIETHNSRVQHSDEEKNYLSYEDLPPPSPEERERLIARVRRLYDRVAHSERASDIPGFAPDTFPRSSD